MLNEPSDTDVDVLTRVPPSADQPIRRAEEDRLRRAGFALALADQIAAVPGRSVAIALTGPWGSGKTSLLNLIEDQLGSRDQAVVVRFNPWLFSGTEQLVAHFFDELSSQIVEKASGLSDIGAKLRRYGDALSSLKVIPVAGEWIGLGGSILKGAGTAMGDKPPPSLRAQRDALSATLAETDRPVVVMVDDIDRLEDDEIRHVMRLVRLVADFPNMIYVLAFDVRRVAAVLSRGGTQDGYKYLEKIVQLQYPVPEIGRNALEGLLTEEIERTLDALREPVSRERVDDVLEGIVAPLLGNVRDVRRYINVLPFTLSLLGQEVAVADLLALEALRLFMPQAFERLPLVLDMSLTARASDEGGLDAVVDFVDSLADSAGDAAPTLNEFLEQVLPLLSAATDEVVVDVDDRKRWSTDHRVADPKYLRIYFEKALPTNVVATATIAQVAALLDDAARLEDELKTLTNVQFADLCRRLPPLIQPLSAAAVGAALIVLTRRSQHRSAGAGATARYPILNRELTRALLESIGDIHAASEVVKATFDSVERPADRRALIMAVERGPGRARLITPAALADLQRRLKDQLLALTPDELVSEPLLGLLFSWVVSVDQTSVAEIHERMEDDRVYLQAAATATTVVRSRLVMLFGEAAEIRQRLASLTDQRTDPAFVQGLNRLERIVEG